MINELYPEFFPENDPLPSIKSKAVRHADGILCISHNTKNDLLQIDLHKKNDRVTIWSLVITTNGNYFIAIGIGKLIVENETIYSISLASPIGKLLNNKKVNEKFKFRGKGITILEIV